LRPAWATRLHLKKIKKKEGGRKGGREGRKKGEKERKRVKKKCSITSFPYKITIFTEYLFKNCSHLLNTVPGTTLKSFLSIILF
jgi:hypothetical protein